MRVVGIRMKLEDLRYEAADIGDETTAHGEGWLCSDGSKVIHCADNLEHGLESVRVYLISWIQLTSMVLLISPPLTTFQVILML